MNREELKPCPFCGKPPREPIHYNGTLETGCEDHQCAGSDVLAPIACWNARSPIAPSLEEAPDPRRHDRYFAEGRLLSIGKDDEGRETMTLEVDHAGGITLKQIWDRWPVTLIARDPRYSAPSLRGDLGSLGPKESALHAEAEAGREPSGGAS